MPLALHSRGNLQSQTGPDVGLGVMAAGVLRPLSESAQQTAPPKERRKPWKSRTRTSVAVASLLAAARTPRHSAALAVTGARAPRVANAPVAAPAKPRGRSCAPA